MISEVIDILDDEYLDDPITLIDYEQARINAISHSTGCPKIGANQTKPSDLPSHSQDSDSTYGKSHFILPVTFFDIASNLRLLNECRPVAIKIVDYDKHPWYYRKFKINTRVNQMDDQEKNFENHQNSEGVLISAHNKNMNKITSMLEKQKQKNKLFKKSSFYLGKKVVVPFDCRKDMEKKLAINNKNVLEIDYKKNVGLVGLKITPRIDVNGKINSSNKSNKQNRGTSNKVNEVNSYILDVDKVLNDVGTIIIPVRDEKDSKIKEIRQLDQDRPTKNYLKKMKKRERKERRIREKLEKKQNKSAGVAGQLVASSLKSYSMPLPNESTTKRSNVKDKTKTNKYFNDLMKMKTATEHKFLSLQLQLRADVMNDINSTNETISINKTTSSNETDSNHDTNKIITIDDIFEKCDLSPNIESTATIDPGIKSPVLPCNKPTPKCGSGQIKPNKVTAQYVNIAEKTELGEIPKIDTIDIITDVDPGKGALVSEIKSTDNLIRNTAQDTSQNSLKAIVISNVMSVSNKNTIKVRDNINAAPKQYIMCNSEDHNIPIITVSTHKPITSNHIKTKPQISIKPVERGLENYHKLSSANSRVHINTSSEIVPNNGVSKCVPAKQKLSPPRNNHHNYHPYLPIQTYSHMESLHNQLQNDPKEKPENVNLHGNSIHCYNSISPTYHANFIPNNYAHCSDPNKANFEQNSIAHRNINTLPQPLMTMNCKNMYWPYWPPPPPPPLPPLLPPPPPPPPLNCPEDEPQNNNKNQPSKLKTTKIGYLSGKNINNNGDRSYTPPRNAAVTINIQNYNNPSVRGLPKVPVNTTAEPLKSKTEMFEELEKEMVKIHKDISKLKTAQKLPNVPEVRPISDVACTSFFFMQRPSAKQVTLDNKISSQNESLTQANLDGKNLSSQGNKLSAHLYNPQENKFMKGHVFTNNKVPSKKDSFGYLLGKKINNQPKISPIKSKVAPLSTIKENKAIYSGQIGSKGSNVKSGVSTGYSPPILPIPTYENSLDLLYLTNSGSGKMQPVLHSNLRDSSTLNLDYDITSQKKKKNQDRYDLMKMKKISLKQYKERSKSDIPFAGTTDTLPFKRFKCSRKNDSVSKSVKTLSDIVNPHSEQDLGYGSDSTIKI
ncbi:hypothetical protein evm_006730 [Chilo suppressalis]|nr:hypothetical protein evm_006730 [Chilo suppressalis]